MHIAFIFILVHFFSHFSEINPIEIPQIDINESNQEKIEKPTTRKNISIILEVEGNPEKHKRYIENYYPSIEVVTTYSTLFQGIALKGPPEKIRKLADLHFIKGIYPVQTYTTLETESLPIQLNQIKKVYQSFTNNPNIVFPAQLNKTTYTGKDVKIAVIDTGIDFNHPDLIMNYQGGFDLVDLDHEPLETTIKQGLPTSHGTHVAGIIAANGYLKGVAPNGKIYAYRALGPGGVGTSIQVIAAMEEAVKAGAAVMNLSLGNTVNGPDYPTSKAVNEASKQGVAVVVANGNDGPTNWTVGAPATASSALSVGAYQHTGSVPYLYEPIHQKKIPLSPLKVAPIWDLQKDYQITNQKSKGTVQGKIALIKQSDTPVAAEIVKLQSEGAVAAIIEQTDPINQQWMMALKEAEIKIPVALISKKDGNWINEYINEKKIFFKNKYEMTEKTIANFSSRGPVTLNWMLKPDIIAPGVNILSTVPGGYEMLNGTSMAAPHVAGAIAVIKEAQPGWTNKQIFGALKTTAEQIKTRDGLVIDPIIQGAGLINIEKAIQTETIIEDPLLSFGKIQRHIETRTINLIIHNLSNDKQQFYFEMPKKVKGLSWGLTQSFIIEGMGRKEIPIDLKMNALQLSEGLHQGYLTLHRADHTYHLPYILINETANYRKVMGFSFRLNQLNKDVYEYQLYVAEPVRSVQVQLFDPQSLVYEGSLVKWTDLEVGMNKGEIKRREITKRGRFYGLIVVQLQNGEFINYDTEVFIE